MQDIGRNSLSPEVQREVTHYRLNTAYDGEKGGRDVQDFHSRSAMIVANKLEYK